jgi:hypothetical protein
MCDFCAYLRRCYVAPVLYRTAAGRCGTILGAVLDDAATDLAGVVVAKPTTLKARLIFYAKPTTR